MADVNKIQLPDTSTVNIKDYRIPGVDTEPTSGSDNVITSGGIYAANYAGSTSNGGPANMTVSIPFAKPDATSTSTAYTVQVDGITELRDGVCFYLMNDRVTSASGFTVDVNDLGAKRVYLTTAAATRATTQMIKDYTWLLVYNETRYSGGCWDLVYTYNTNTTYSLNYLFDGSPWYVQHTLYRYQLMFQVDEKTVTPFNANSNTTGTTKTIHTDYEFDPFGKIFYYSTTGTISANATVSASYCAFVRSAVDLRYTFNVSTSVNPLSLDYSPVYLKINIDSETGMATLNSNLPLTQTLPTTNDGIYYLYLGRSTTTKYTCSLEAHHPIYYHNGITLCELLPDETINTIKDIVESQTNEIEEVTASALNDLNDRTLDLESSVSPLETTVSSLNTSVSEIEENLDNMNEPLSFLSDDKARGAFTIYRTIHPFKNELSATSQTYNIYANTLTIIGSSSSPISGNKTFTLNTSTYITTAQYDGLTANHYFWTFDTGSTAPTITWPAGLTWPGGLPPVLSPNKHYEISVLNNIVAWMEV